MKFATRELSAEEAQAADARWKAQIADERAHDRNIARLFAEACRAGGPDALHKAAQLMSETIDGWRLAMRRVAKLGEVSPEIRASSYAASPTPISTRRGCG